MDKNHHTVIKCLTAIALHHGMQTNLEHLIDEYTLVDDQEPSPALLLRMAASIGLEAKLEKLSWESLFVQGSIFPIMARLNNGDVAIIVGVRAEEGGKVAILDPLSNFPVVQILNGEQFCTRWEGEVVFFKQKYPLSDSAEKIMIHQETIESQSEPVETLAGTFAVDDLLPKDNLKTSETLMIDNSKMKQEYIDRLLSDKEAMDSILGFLLSNKTKLFKHGEVRSFVSQRAMEKKIAEGELKIIESASAKQDTTGYNLESLKNLLGFDRGGALVDVFMTLYGDVLKDNAKYLCIGPRNEAELYAVIGYGINPENVFALDLISSEPFVTSGDMHSMPFPNDSFDTIFVGWVLAYSNDPEQACSEIIRVAKDGAHILVGCDFSGIEDQYAGYHFATAEDIFKLFRDTVGERIIVRNPHAPYEHNSRKIIAGFVLNKNGSGLQAEINEAKRLEGDAIQEFYNSLPAELKSNAEITYRFDVHANSLLDFSDDAQAMENAYLIMRKHYALFGNVIDHAVSSQISRRFPRSSLKLEQFQSIFTYNELDLESATKDLNEDGYHICPFRLNAQGILEITKQFKDNTGPARLIAGTSNELIDNNAFILDLFVDRYFIEVVSRYLDTIPVLDSIEAWHTNAGYISEEKMDQDAMMFHFDKDRIAWLKCFIYLDDITTDNGPHCYVPGSHRNRGGELLHDGRFTDEEIIQYYGPDSIKMATGLAGTIILADTHCLHRGSLVNTGRRRLLQLQYSNSLFGAKTEPLSLDEVQSAKLEPLIASNPRMFMNCRFPS